MDVKDIAYIYQDITTNKIANFLVEIGLEVSPAEITRRTFLPGILIDHGTLCIDEAQLTHPGDLLHEAGHLALKTPAQRKAVEVDTGSNGGEEMGAIAWSYAALIHLQLEPQVVFHDEGYKGGAVALISNFTSGHYIGVPMLQWLGLAAEGKQAREMGIEPYPKMIKWLRDG